MGTPAVASGTVVITVRVKAVYISEGEVTKEKVDNFLTKGFFATTPYESSFVIETPVPDAVITSDATEETPSTS